MKVTVSPADMKKLDGPVKLPQPSGALYARLKAPSLPVLFQSSKVCVCVMPLQQFPF